MYISLVGTKLRIIPLVLLLISACATPDRVNNPRVFQDTAARLTEFLSDNGFQFTYQIINSKAIFPSAVYSDRSLDTWHQLLDCCDLTPPVGPPDSWSPQRAHYKYQISTAEYLSSVDNLAWAVLSQDRLHKLKVIDLRNRILINRAFGSTSQHAKRILQIMNRNPEFFSSSEFASINGSIARLSSIRSEALARARELESDICSGSSDCNSSVLTQAAMSFSRKLQHDLFLSGYPDERYIGFVSEKVVSLKAARDLELYYLSFNTEAEAERVLRFEQALAFYEELLNAHQSFRTRYLAQLPKGGHATSGGYNEGLDRISTLNEELAQVADEFETGTTSLAVSLRLLEQIETESDIVDASFVRFSSLIVSGYYLETEDYSWPN